MFEFSFFVNIKYAWQMTGFFPLTNTFLLFFFICLFTFFVCKAVISFVTYFYILLLFFFFLSCAVNQNCYFVVNK